MFYPIGFGGHHFFLYLIIPAILGIWAQIRVTGAFNRWGKVRASSNITGAECAREILQAAQIPDVDVVETNDFLGDHYDPTSKRLCLSSNVYNTPSVAALGIAAHETGHAIQHAKAYAPLMARMTIVPVTQVASQLLPFIIIGGFLFGITGLVTFGIFFFLLLALVPLFTPPVGFLGFRGGENIFSPERIVQAG